jgi:hypothetical protein
MSQACIRYAVAATFLTLTVGICPAQLRPNHDAWLMQNYRFTGPLPPGERKPVDPALTELKEIQGVVRAIMRRASFEGDYESAIIAAGQAVANAQLIGAVVERQQAAQAAQSAVPVKPATQEASLPTTLFLIALKDKTINTASSYFVDGRMLNYTTLQGVHMIVRMDLVDRGLTRDLNRRQNIELHLPE